MKLKKKKKILEKPWMLQLTLSLTKKNHINIFQVQRRTMKIAREQKILPLKL